MARYHLIIEYDGAPFRGWQRQRAAGGREERAAGGREERAAGGREERAAGGREERAAGGREERAAGGREEANPPTTIQEALERAAQAFCGAPTVVFGSGRTDRGVHASGQSAHVDFAAAPEPVRVREALNAHLRPLPIVVRACRRVDDDFHARFSAVKRRYRYDLLMRPTPPALLRGRVWHRRRPLDVDAMRRAARMLIGTHDFSTFRSSRCQSASAVKTLDLLSMSLDDDRLSFFCAARSFMHTQVRSMVGSLAAVGSHRWGIDDFAAAFAARHRSACAPPAPPCGLYLIGVDYA